jgi:catechol 2,3-dioxygenase-like lactoylglutathione lyase family enzyme
MLKNVLAFAGVRDFERAVRWYTMLLGREPDKQPMKGLAEWKFDAGGWLQVNESKLAGRGSITLVETDIDERLKILTKSGIQARSVSRGEKVSIIIITDPDGNQIVFAQGKDENHLSAM